MIMRFEAVTFSHVRRDQNEAAHAMTMEGCHLAVDYYWIKEAPKMAAEVAKKDRMRFTHC